MADVLVVFGTRPEAIKMAPLVRALLADDRLDTKICVTAQHREMLDQVLSIFDIIPDYDFDLMQKGQDLFDLSSRILLKMRDLLNEVQPRLILVHGDTTTAFAAAAAGFFSGIPVGHVEAGLRTHDLQAPFPEEFNRRVVGLVSGLHFAPTAASRANLLAEGVAAEQIEVTGNTVIDALQWVTARLETDEALQASVDAELDAALPFAWRDTPFVLMTGHRRENFGDGFKAICEAIGQAAARYDRTISFTRCISIRMCRRRSMRFWRDMAMCILSRLWSICRLFG